MIFVGNRITNVNRDIQPVFTLKHLSLLSGVDYGFLRSAVSRESDAYTTFRISKRVRPHEEMRYRCIHVPSPALMRVQRWISNNILSHVHPHRSSVAFSPGDRLVDAVQPHCPSKWLVKFDIHDFFDSINEVSVYHVFSRIGYEPLISFEMARLCTYLTYGKVARSSEADSLGGVGRAIARYDQDNQGHLPQGAPTSPMLANLVCCSLDARLSAVADRCRLRYTRYADDMTFSSGVVKYSRSSADELIKSVYNILNCCGLRPNLAKTVVVPPGARKLVLGLSVEDKVPRLTREFKNSIRQHLYYLVSGNVGPEKHAAARKFVSTIGLRSHLNGLLSYAAQIEPVWAAKQRVIFARVAWPY